MPVVIQRRLYSGLQIFGGGLLVMNWLNTVGDATSAGIVILTTTLAALGVVGALAALMYLDGNPRANRWCLYFWALQVPTFATAWASYRFLAGGDLRVGLKTSPAGLFYNFQLGFGLIARIQQEGPIAYIGVNVLALAAVIFFRRELTKAQARVARAP